MSQRKNQKVWVNAGQPPKFTASEKKELLSKIKNKVDRSRKLSQKVSSAVINFLLIVTCFVFFECISQLIMCIFHAIFSLGEKYAKSSRFVTGN
jgi:hypothetical protein